MFKIFSLELKKLFTRVWFYVFLLVLVAVLAITAFTFKPIQRNYEKIIISGETVNEIYNNFNKHDGVKYEYDQRVLNVTTTAELYINTNVKNEINAAFEEFNSSCIRFQEQASTLTSQQSEDLFNTIKTKFDNFNFVLNKFLEPTKNQTGYFVLTSESNYTKLYSIINKIAMEMITSVNNEVVENYCSVYSKDLAYYLDSLIYPKLKDTAAKYKLNSYLNNITTLRLEEINQKIDNFNLEATSNSELNSSSVLKDKILGEIEAYISVANLYINGFENNICVQALSSLSSNQRKSLIGYSNILLNECEDKAVLSEHCIINNLNPNDYASGLSATHTSNYNKNAYDFTYYVIGFVAILITLFAIYSIANSVSGKKSTNTLLAVKPIGRKGILFGKYFSIMFASLLILLACFGICFVVGGAMYGYNTSSILMVFNGQFVLTINPIISLMLYALSLMLIIMLYGAITLMLSTFIKNKFIIAIIISLFYIGNLALPVMFDVYSWLRFYPLANINLMAYFSGNQLTNTSVIAKLFNCEIYYGMRFIISLSYILVITILMLWIANVIFRKKDL